MGREREIVYCVKCRKRIDSDDFDRGAAVEFRDQAACDACIGDLIAPLSLKEQEQILAAMRTAKEQGREQREVQRRTPGRSLTPARAYPPVRTGSGTKIRTRPEEVPPGRSVVPALLLCLLLVLGVVGGVLYLNGTFSATAAAGPIPPPSPPQGTPSVPPPRNLNVLVHPKEAAARAALEKAREHVKTQPADVTGQLELLRKAVAESEGTTLAEEAKKEFQASQKKVGETVAADLAALDKETLELSAKEEFRRAIDALEKARNRHNRPDWPLQIEVRIRDVKNRASSVFGPLRDKAVTAQRKGATQDVTAVVAQVERWGLPDQSTLLRKALADASGGAAPPPPASTSAPPPPAEGLKPLTVEGKAYQARWMEALALAGTRDFDAALATLRKAADAATEPDLKKEAQADLDTLTSVASLHREALDLLSKWPRGGKLALDHLDDEGKPARVNAPFLRADREVVEVLAGKEALPIELAEVTARSLAEIFKARPAPAPGSDARAAAFSCIFEGDAVGARSHLGGPPEAIPWKYWAHAARLDETRPGASTEAGKRALAARKLYFAAEAEHRDLRTRGASIERYRALLNEYADTPLVKQKRARITARRESARDYVFLSEDLAAQGTFKAATFKSGTCWTSAADSDPAKGAKGNYVEFEFYALQDVAYKCWVMAGACCQEVYLFYAQATELTVPHPQTKEPLSADPGSNLSVPVKNSITFLKAKHETHGGPKESRRWEWVQVALPKYSTAGLKKLRLLTDQKGFSIAWAAVSASRTDPPRDGDMKEVLKARAPVTLEDPVAAAVGKEPEKEPVAPARDPNLVGHWRLDDQGGSAADASGHDNSGVPAGEPEKVPGKLGSGLALDGKDRLVNIPNSPSLENVQEGSYTISLWFKPAAPPPAGVSYALVSKSDKGVGLRYMPDQKLVMDHALGTDAPAAATSASPFAPGQFHHVTGVVDRAAGMTSLYVNGKLEGSLAWPSGTAAKEFGQASWKIGPAQGVVDDVRLYTRALSAADVRTLASAK